MSLQGQWSGANRRYRRQCGHDVRHRRFHTAPREGRPPAGDRGQHNHGLLVASPSIAEAFNAMYWLEMACRAQVDAMSSGAELIIPSQEIVTKTHHLYQPSVRRPFGLMEWPAMLRYLDRRNPGYDE